MEYEYIGDAHHDLVDSYRQYTAPFIRGTSVTFPPRTHLREEVGLLKQLLFPRSWNASALIDDPDETWNRLTELGRLYSLGATAYADGEPAEQRELLDVTAAILTLLPLPSGPVSPHVQTVCRKLKSSSATQ